jgi:hypothetical protein
MVARSRPSESAVRSHSSWLTDRRGHGANGRACRAGDGSLVRRSPPEAIREKCGKTYATQHPIELVICADDMEVELLEPPSPKFAGEAAVLLQHSPFQRIWVVKLTKAENLVWFTCSRA